MHATHNSQNSYSLHDACVVLNSTNSMGDGVARERGVCVLGRTMNRTPTHAACLHRCIFRSEKETLILLENPEFQGNLMQWLYRREKQVHNGQKLITQDERA